MKKNMRAGPFSPSARIGEGRALSFPARFENGPARPVFDAARSGLARMGRAGPY